MCDLVVRIVTTRLYREKCVNVLTGLYDSALGPVTGSCKHGAEIFISKKNLKNLWIS